MADPIFTPPPPRTNPFGLTDVGADAMPSLVDIDGDGDLDAFVGNGDGNTLFYRNTGTADSPTFATPSTNPFGLTDVGSNAKPTFADIDGDGDLDAFVGDYFGNILFYRNTGTANNPVFDTASSNPFGLTNPFNLTYLGYLASPTFADIDGDSDLDAFVGNLDGNMLFYRNIGTANSPAFAAPVTNSFGLTDVGQYASPALVDIDGDGDLDVLVGNSAGNTLFYRNTGTASSPAFDAPATNPFGLTDVNGSASPTLVDIDDDGDLDAFVGNYDGNMVFYLNKAISPINIVQTGGSTAVSEGGATDIYTVALNRAPTADVTISLNTTNNQVTSNINTLTFTATNWAVPQTVTVTAINDTVGEGKHTGVIQHTATSADSRYNGIDASNVVVTITDNDLPVTDPVFNTASTNPFGLMDVGSYVKPTFADIDGDGDLDAFVGNWDGNIQYFHNTGTASSPAFDTPSTNLFGLTDVGVHASPTFADIDSDGDLDAFVGEGYGNTLFYRNTGTVDSPAFAAPSTNPFGLTDVGFSARPTFVDIDGDGDLDAFVGEGYGNTLFYRNIGTVDSPAFAAPSTNLFGLTDVGFSARPTFADIDGDGDLDALVGESGGNTLFYCNTGTADSPVFDAASTNPFGLTDVGSFASPTFADIDGDGDLDTFVGNYDGNMVFYLNKVISPIPPVNIVQTGGSTAVSEGGATDTYTVALNSVPTADVTISLNTTNNQVASNINSLTFTATNWAVPQTVTVTAINDTVGEGKHTGVIQHTVTSTDSRYNGIDVNNVVVAITDNDLPLTDPVFNTANSNPFGLTDVGKYASPTLADIDGDGDLDAFVGERYGDTWFYRNTGTVSSPAFAAPVSNPFGLTDVGAFANPTFADIDGDGDLDAFVGNTDGNTLFYRNTGTADSPVFAAASSNPFGLTDVNGSANPTFADIDGDGDLDVFVGDGSGTLFYRNTGTVNSPVFDAGSRVFDIASSGGAGIYASPTLVDIDGDGDLDAFVGDQVHKTLFYRNTGTADSPVFAAASSNPFGLTDVGTFASPALVDIDGDGDLDAFVGNFDGDIQFYLNKVISPISPVNIVQTGGSSAVSEGGATDTYTVALNNAPTADVTVSLNTTNNQVASNINSLTFTAANWAVPQTVTVTAINDTVGEGKHTGVIQHTVTSADSRYNGIDVSNVIIAITDNDLPLTDPVFNYTSTTSFGYTNVGIYAKPTLVDIDGDGDLDMFVGEFHGDTLFYSNTGTISSPAFAAPITNPFGLTHVSLVASPTFADIDGDGDLDAFVGNQSSNISFYRNVGTADSPAFDVASSNPFGLIDVGFGTSPTLVDIDGDGDLDAFVGEYYGNTSFYRNTGTASNPAFDTPVTNPFGLTDVGSNAKPTFADIDGDGDLDAFVGSNDNGTFFYRNTGTVNSPAFAAPLAIIITNLFGLTDAGSFASPALVDIDGDGDLDAFFGNVSGQAVFYLNNPAPTLTAFSSPLVNGNEDSEVTVNFAALQSQGNEADVDGSVSAFVIKAISSGSLKIGTSAGIAKAWNAKTNNTVDATHTAYWTPATNANGTLNAFTVTAKDNNGAVSVTPVQAQVAVTAVNDAPVLTAPKTINYTDTVFDDSFATATGKLVGSDIDSKSLSYGITGGTDNGNGTVSQTSTYGVLTVTKTTGAYSFAANDAAIEALTVNANADFTVTASDGLLSSSKTLVITIAQKGATESVGNDTLTGTSANNTFDGLAGNDIINGLAGADKMTGGLGNDTYVVDNKGDVVTETSTLATEIDSVNSSVNFTLGANVENLTLTGTKAISGMGNELVNIMTGNTAKNLLVGDAGNDILDGGTGNDVLTGGTGSDVFRFTSAPIANRDTITDFSVADDTIQLENSIFSSLGKTGMLKAANFVKAAVAQDVNDYVVYNPITGALLYDMDGNGAGAAEQIALLGVNLALTSADFGII